MSQTVIYGMNTDNGDSFGFDGLTRNAICYTCTVSYVERKQGQNPSYITG